MQPMIDMMTGLCTDYVAKGESCHYQGWTGCGCQPGMCGTTRENGCSSTDTGTGTQQDWY